MTTGLRIFTEPQQGATYDDQLAMARAAERAGFDAYFRSDHFLSLGRGDGLPGPTDAWLTLAGLARETSRLRLGTLVTSATFRQPGLLAVQVAQVDAMSGGRVELGLGTGWMEAEHTAYGVPFPRLSERFDRLEETLAIVTGLWATPPGERFSFAGAHWTLADSPALPKPVQRPRPPVIVGGAGTTRTPRLAAAFADEFNTPFLLPDEAAAAYDRVRAACTEAGRDPGSVLMSAAVAVVCGADPGELERRAAATGRSVEQCRERGVAGLPAEVVEGLAAYVEAGAQRLYLQLLDLTDPDQVHLLGAEVAPHFR